jgi:hypothetical protein
MTGAVPSSGRRRRASRNSIPFICGSIHVEDDHGRSRPRHHAREHLETVRRSDDPVSLAGEDFRQRLAGIRVVFDEQDRLAPVASHAIDNAGGRRIVTVHEGRSERRPGWLPAAVASCLTALPAS